MAELRAVYLRRATWGLARRTACFVLAVLAVLAATGATAGGKEWAAARPPDTTRSFGVPTGVPTKDRGERAYFAPTGHYVEGVFLSYWREHGGLALFGYPLTPAFVEGGYSVQYFERARFELHPENAGTPYEVLLGQMGRERLRSEGRQVPPRESAVLAAGGAHLFEATGYRVGGVFLRYWDENGGLPLFGYPISPQMEEPDGGLTVQYFERARFELYPEYSGTPSEVLLTLLGVERAEALDPALRDRWVGSGETHGPLLHLARDYGRIETLTQVAGHSDVAGEVRVLGGDNRQYAVFKVEAGVPFTYTVTGWRGTQSLMLYRGGEVTDALWGAYYAISPVWGVISGDPVWDNLYDRVGQFLEHDAVDHVAPDGTTPVRGYRSPDNAAIWLRDHVYQSKGFKYIEPDMKSALDYFATTQRDNGSLDDFYFHLADTPVFTNQVEVEADREYLFVEGVWTAWQATGDEKWLASQIGTMERSMEHLWGDTKRWSPEQGLIKRAFTIDTWDFEQGSAGNVIRRDIDEATRWSIMHGDNTGAYHAARLLAGIERRFGRGEQAALWDSRAERLRDNLNRLSWNGHFYTHQVHLTPVDPTGVDESKQLSLSNAYALNRGTLSQEQAAEVIRTYQARRAEHGSSIFAEWYSIDPPFPYGFGTPGEYVNGGVMPLVGGELARGAFEHGFDGYGVDILRRYWAMLEKDHGSFLWYHPDGTPGLGTLDTLSTDGWGSAAMLNALAEGLAGVVDRGKLYEDVALSPRWAAPGAGVAAEGKQVKVGMHYEASGVYFAYNLGFGKGEIRLAWGGKSTRSVALHLLLPEGFAPVELLVDGTRVAFSTSRVEGSVYLDADLPGAGQLVVR